MKKKTRKQGLAVLLALFMAINSCSGFKPWTSMDAYADVVRTAVVNATTLNVRSGPGTSKSIVAKLTNGTSVSVLGETTGTDGKMWYHIQFGGGSKGYVLSSYLKFPTAYTSDANFEQYLNSQGFPESYKAGLRQLHAEYPNWVFKAQHTNLDWETVITNESVVGRNLVYSSSISSWKSTAEGAYDWNTSTWPGLDSSSYVAASDGIIRYYMDPRNFLDDKYVFQFLVHTYNSSLQTADGLRAMVQNTFLGGNSSVSGTLDFDISTGNNTSQRPGSTTTPGSSTGPIAPGYNPGSNSGNQGGPGSGTGTTSGGGSLTRPGTSSGGSSQGGPGSSSGGTSQSGPGSSSGGVSLGGPGTSSGGSQSGTGSSSGKVSLEGPGAYSKSGKTISSTKGAALIQKKETSRVTTPVGPGMSGGPGTAGTSSGTPVNNGSSGTASYVDILMSAAAQSGVNPYVLAAMIIQEQGTGGTGRCISGSVAGYVGYYNFFNIEAYQSGSMNAVSRGLWYASQSGSYGRPWNSVDKSIIGGAVYYGTNYVNVGQDTFYLKKFNVQGNNLYKHQYMTNIQGAAAEGAKLAEAYGQQVKQSALEFKIPVYLNMPATACPKPTGDGSPNNKLSGLGVEGFSITPTFNRDTTSYNLIVSPSVTSVTVNASPLSSMSSVSGTGTIQLQSGNNEITVSVTAQNGTVRNYMIHVVRQNDGPSYNSALGSGVSSGTNNTTSNNNSNGPGYNSVSPGPNLGGSTGIGPGASTGNGSAGTGPGASNSGGVSGTGPGASAGNGNQTMIGGGPNTSGGNNSGSVSGPGGSNVTIVR